MRRTGPVKMLGVAASVAALCLVGSGCTRVVDDAQPRSVPPAAPVSELQVHDLLSDDVSKSDGDLFVTVEPERCAGVAREVDPPFLHDLNPLATTGGHWITDDGSVYVEEMVAVYPSDFDAAAALADVQRVIDSCAGTSVDVTSLSGGGYPFQVQAATTSDDTVLWALRNPRWNCDNAYLAAHNVAIEITACGYVPGYDVGALAEQAHERIESLVNTVA